jgi:two-component system sensor histidine kinase AlgZ
MAVTALPYVGQGTAGAFRMLYLSAFLLWVFPLTWLQRQLWRHNLSWQLIIPVLLAVTYGLSLVDNVMGQTLSIYLGTASEYKWSGIFRGLDGCWIPMIAFCASHAVVASYAALGHERLRLEQALAGAQDAELRALRYQLQPHFLFNTLNAISSLVANGRSRDATLMITQLADFLRATLDGGNAHEHPLADELALTSGYLEIEKARLGDRLAVRLKVAPGLLDVPVPYLILQPLVENAIRHGIAPRRATGRMDLTVTRDGGKLRILLDNDLPAPGQHGTLPGVGIANVAARLSALYGENHEFAAEAGRQGRFRVTVALPIRIGKTADKGPVLAATSAPA